VPLRIRNIKISCSENETPRRRKFEAHHATLPRGDRVLQLTGSLDHFDLTRTDAETGDPGLLGTARSGESGAR
jgi:hypothetical protein